jgi:hypothetical protein
VKSKNKSSNHQNLPHKTTQEVLLEMETFVEEKKEGSDSFPESSKSAQFISFLGTKGNQLHVRKSSCLWAWERNKERVSTDRVFRYINDQKKELVIDNSYLSVGDYACFLVGEEVFIGHVMGFTYLSGKRTEYTLSYCPLKPDIPKKKQRGIAALCSQFLIGDRVLIPKSLTEYVNIDYYKMHVNVEAVGTELQLTTDSYKNVSKFF